MLMIECFVTFATSACQCESILIIFSILRVSPRLKSEIFSPPSNRTRRSQFAVPLDIENRFGYGYNVLYPSEKLVSIWFFFGQYKICNMPSPFSPRHQCDVSDTYELSPFANAAINFAFSVPFLSSIYTGVTRTSCSRLRTRTHAPICDCGAWGFATKNLRFSQKSCCCATTVCALWPTDRACACVCENSCGRTAPSLNTRCSSRKPRNKKMRCRCGRPLRRRLR